MAVTVTTKNYTYLDDCESLSPWSGLVDALVGDFYKEGSNCLGMELWGSGTNDHTLTGSWDLSGIKHLHLWWMTTVLNELDTDANGGFQIGMSDGSNTGFWKVSGSTTYPGGWYNPVLDLSRAVDSGTKPSMSAITSIIFRWVLTSNAKKVQSCWIDNIYCADGLIAYGDLSGSPFAFSDILSADQNTANGWGMIRQIGGVYFLVGSLTFGDDSGTNGCEFEDSSQVLIFENRPVNVSGYSIDIVGNSTGDTGFQLGDVAGGRGTQGCVVRVQDVTQIPKFEFNATDVNVSGFRVYGTTLLDAAGVSFPTASVTREVLSSSFESCGEILPSTCKVQYCNIVSANDRGIRISDADFDITDTTFISCPSGVHISISGAFDFDGLVFSDCGYDVENSTAGVVTVNNLPGGANASTYINTGGGSTVIQTGVYITVNVKDADTDPIENAQVAVYKSSDNTELMNEDTTSLGVAQATYNYTGDTAVYIRVRKSSTGATKYIPVSTTGTITDTGLTVTVTLYEDTTAL